jgi:uncharacterized protein (TIGR03083 family)
VDPAVFLDYLHSDGEALAGAARAAPSAPIPSCPEWDMTGLLTHLGAVHRWVDLLVATKSAAYVKRQHPTFSDIGAAVAWYQEGLRQLEVTLGAADPHQPVWNWFDGQAAPARFWIRRMAHETAMHRWDGEAAAGDATPIGADLAVDGVDEFLSFVGRWLARSPIDSLHGSLHLHATDADGEWTLNLWPDRLEQRREHAKADAALRGPASDLLLWMLNRQPADSPRLQVFGDRAIVECWGRVKF